MLSFYSKKNFLTFFIPSFIIAVLLFGAIMMWEKRYEKKQIHIGDTYEIVVAKLEKQPSYIFQKGEESKLQEMLKNKKIVLTENDAFIPDGAYSNAEVYGKIIFPKKTSYGQEPYEIESVKDIPTIEARVVLYTKEDLGYHGPAVFAELYYFDTENKIQKILQGEGLVDVNTQN